MSDIIAQIRKVGLMPVIKLDDPTKAVPLARALKNGGIPVAEVTFRAAGAEKAIAAIREEVPEVLVGAGTVITKEQVDKAVDAGALYIICPGFDKEIVEYCISKGVAVIPGCTTAGDVSIASRLGLQTVKFFPAEAAGGIKMLRSLTGPFPSMEFIPTGGIGPDNLKEYLSLNPVVACGGSWMVPEDTIARNDFSHITDIAKQAVVNMLDISVAHIGINSDHEDEAKSSARIFADLLGSAVSEIPVSFFCGSAVEVMKGSDRGQNGHIALGVTDIDRAVFYFENKGYSFDKSSIRYTENGKTRFIYLKEEFAGFAIHLTLK